MCTGLNSMEIPTSRGKKPPCYKTGNYFFQFTRERLLLFRDKRADYIECIKTWKVRGKAWTPAWMLRLRFFPIYLSLLRFSFSHTFRLSTSSTFNRIVFLLFADNWVKTASEKYQGMVRESRFQQGWEKIWNEKRKYNEWALYS